MLPVLLAAALLPLPARSAPAPGTTVSCYEAGRRLGQAVLAGDVSQEKAALDLLETAHARSRRLAPRSLATERCGQLLLPALWRRAQRLERAHAYRACSRAYAAMAQRFRRSSKAAALLWNGSVCAQRAADSVSAIDLLRDLVARYPRSRIVASAMRGVAELYRDLARYRDAAAWYERFALRFPKRRDARRGLATAALMRAALGDRPALVRAIKAFERLHAHRAPVRTAEVAWLLVHERRRHSSAAATRRATEQWLRRHGRRGPRRLVLEAHRWLGQHAWQASCPVPTIHGICARRWRRGRLPKLRRRHAQAVQRAQRHLRRVELLHRAQRAPQGHPSFVWSKLLRTELQLEPLLRKHAGSPRLVQRLAERFHTCAQVAGIRPSTAAIARQCVRRCARLDPKRCARAAERYAPSARPGIRPAPANFRGTPRARATPRRRAR